ncbi:MAG: excisionase family DNA-binding protein [Candidatus Omnitrophica bacterium]|nr:excisionase family DNA-binding protein [Candidatus Omnitrophota bacterium]
MSYFIRHNDYLTTAQASKFLNVTRFTVLNWIKEGKLQSASTLGGHQRIPKTVVLSALKQIKSTNTLKPVTTETTKTVSVNCWESNEITSCGTHDCNKCIVFKKKMNLCFLAVEQYGSLKRECPGDCLSCDYLAKHHPQEKKFMKRQQEIAATDNEAETQDNEVSVNGILKKVFYNSGRLVAKIGQLSNPPAPKKYYKRDVKKTRKG